MSRNTEENKIHCGNCIYYCHKGFQVGYGVCSRIDLSVAYNESCKHGTSDESKRKVYKTIDFG